MTHIDEKKLWDYIMNDMDGTQTKAVKQHLEACSKCKHAYDLQLQFHKELLEVNEDLPSPNFSDKVIHSLERYIQLEKRLQFWLRFGKIAVINALIIAVVLPLLVLTFQKVKLPLESQLPNKAVLLLLSTCMVLWLLYAIDVLLKRHFNRNMN